MTTKITTKETPILDSITEVYGNLVLDRARGNHARNWNCLRVYPDGTAQIIEEPSACYPESEYFHRVPHPISLHESAGDCFTPSPDDDLWMWEDDESGEYIRDENFKWKRLDSLDDPSKIPSGWTRFKMDLTTPLDDLRDDASGIPDETIEELRKWAEENCPALFAELTA